MPKEMQYGFAWQNPILHAAVPAEAALSLRSPETFFFAVQVYTGKENQIDYIHRMIFLKTRLLQCLDEVTYKDLRIFVMKGLQDNSRLVRLQSVKTLRHFKDQEAVSVCKDLISDPDQEIRVFAARTLVEHKEEEKAIKALIEDQGNSREFKDALLKGMGLSESIAALDIILWCIKQIPELKIAAVSALSQRKSRTDIGHILKVYGKSDARVRAAVAKSFSMQNDRGEDLLFPFLDSGSGEMVSSVSEILEYTGVIEKLIMQLSSFSAEARLASVKRLSRLESFSAFKGLVYAAFDRDKRIAEAAKL